MFKEFKQFIFRGNVIDLAVGVLVGGAFGTVVSALVKDILTPLIAAIVKVPDFSKLLFTINGSQFLYGEFINAVISFIIIATTVFIFIIKPKNILIERSKRKSSNDDPRTKECSECLSEIPFEARRCSHCTQPCVIDEKVIELSN